MNRTLFLAVLTALLPIATRARIGENEMQCDTRFSNSSGTLPGPSISDKINPLIEGPNTTNRTFHFQGWKVQIGFLKGISIREQYRKDGMPSAITSNEVKSILRANGAQWKETTTDELRASGYAFLDVLGPHDGGSIWIRADGSAAYLLTMKYVMRIDHVAALKRDLAARQRKSKQAPIPHF